MGSAPEVPLEHMEGEHMEGVQGAGAPAGPERGHPADVSPWPGGCGGARAGSPVVGPVGAHRAGDRASARRSSGHSTGRGAEDDRGGALGHKCAGAVRLSLATPGEMAGLVHHVATKSPAVAPRATDAEGVD